MGHRPLKTMPAPSVLAGPFSTGRLRAGHLALLGLMGASLLALTPAVRADQGNIVLGSGLGAVAGAIIGHSVGGRDGAIVGGAIGGAVGASAASNGGGYRSHGPAPRYGAPVVVAPYPTYPAYPSYPAYGGPPPRVYYPPVRYVRPVTYVQPIVHYAPYPVYRGGWGHRPDRREGHGRYERDDGPGRDHRWDDDRGRGHGGGRGPRGDYGRGRD